MSTMSTAGQSGLPGEAAGNGGLMQACPAAHAPWDASYQTGQWNDSECAEMTAPYLTICELYQRYVSDGTVLDIGCGTGQLYQCLTEHAGLSNACYTGIDIAGHAVRDATARFPEARIGQRDYGSEYVGSRFDCVVFNESLQCFSDPAAILDKCMRHNMHACSVLIVAMSGREHAALWDLLGRHGRVLDEQTVDGEDGRVWTVRVLKVNC